MTLPPVTFAEPRWLWALLALPALTMLHAWAERTAQRRLALLIASPRLRAELTAAASAARRRWRFALLLLGLGSLVFTVARPQAGYESQPVRRKGIDLIVMVDVSKSMLATDIQPNRLTRAKLAAQDLITKLTGDRAGLVAFAGSAFLEAPLTVDYDAVLTSLNDLDVNTIPRGGTNLEAAINLALEAFGKAEANNRAIVLMTDGEATEGESAAALKAAARARDAGVKIFTVGLGTTEGSLIPLGDGQFVKDREGKIVRTKLDEAGLTKISQTAGGFYLHLQNGPAEMRTLAQDGLGKMKEGDIDAKMNRRPIERYRWPLGAALVFLAAAGLIGERRRLRAERLAGPPAAKAPRAVTVALFLLAAALSASARAEDKAPEPMTLYNSGKYDEAYQGFSELAKKHNETAKLEFDAGASAFRSKKWDAAMDAFGQALTSEDPALQAKAHYNIGNTLYEHGKAQPTSPAKVKDWRDAINHYNNTISLAKGPANEPVAKDAVYNRDLVQKAIDDELRPKPTPTPTPSPSPTPPPDKNKKDNKDDKKDQKGKDDKSDDKKDGKGDNGKGDSQKDKGDSKGQPPKPGDKGDNQQPKPGDKGQPSPSPSPGESPSGQPSPSPGESPSDQGSPPPGESPSPSPGDNKDQTNNPPSDNGKQGDQGSPPPDQPRKSGDFQAQAGESPTPGPEQSPGEMAQANEAPEEKGKMSAAQARALLEALKGEDDKPILDRKKAVDPNINDW